MHSRLDSIQSYILRCLIVEQTISEDAIDASLSSDLLAHLRVCNGVVS